MDCVGTHVHRLLLLLVATQSAHHYLKSTTLHHYMNINKYQQALHFSHSAFLILNRNAFAQVPLLNHNAFAQPLLRSPCAFEAHPVPE